MRYIRPYQSIGRAGKGVASIDICYAAAAYKSVAESEYYHTRCTNVAVACADFATTDVNNQRKDLNPRDPPYRCTRIFLQRTLPPAAEVTVEKGPCFSFEVET